MNPSRGRTPGSFWTLGLGVFTVVIACAAGVAAQGSGRGTQKPAAQQPAALPHISPVAIRVVGPGLGANGTELRPFNEQPGTVVVVAIQPPRGSGIVGVDNYASKLEGFADDKGHSLLEEGRVGSFPKVAEDGSAALVEIEVRARPSAGAASVTAQGTLAVTMSPGSKPLRASGVRLAAEQTFKVGGETLTIGEVELQDDATRITFGLTRTLLNTIRDVRFFDAKNTAIEARRTSSGYMNEKAQLGYEVKTKDKTATVEFELWQNPRLVKVPFNVQAGLAVAAGARTSTSGAPPAPQPPAAEKTPKAPEPPPVIGAADGAASVEAVVKQMQAAALAGRGAQVLSVIHPTDRATFGQAVAMTLAILPMQAMDKPKEAEQLQKQLDALFARHHLKPPFIREPADLFKGVDLAAFVSDAMVFLKAQAKKGDNPADLLPVPSGRAENVTVTGNTAVATLSGKEITFAQISGKWFIRLE